MAYDMFVGDNANDEGPCPPGQIVMLVRTLPQLATALVPALSLSALRRTG
jgi:hypothetical protein